jgi:hypothetical protein
MGLWWVRPAPGGRMRAWSRIWCKTPATPGCPQANRTTGSSRAVAATDLGPWPTRMAVVSTGKLGGKVSPWVQDLPGLSLQVASVPGRGPRTSAHSIRVRAWRRRGGGGGGGEGGGGFGRAGSGGGRSSGGGRGEEDARTVATVDLKQERPIWLLSGYGMTRNEANVLTGEAAKPASRRVLQQAWAGRLADGCCQGKPATPCSRLCRTAAGAPPPRVLPPAASRRAASTVRPCSMRW